MADDVLLTEKIRRRLTPFVVEGRIAEPDLSQSEAYDGQPSRWVVRIRPLPGTTGDAAAECTRALADLGASVVLAVDGT